MTKLFQFWNTQNPPAEVHELMEGWAADADFEYHRYDYESAETYIATHFSQEILAAFRACGVPAMQADFFRYCALYQEGGIWIDADIRNVRKLRHFIPEQGRGLLMNREKRIANDFLFVREARDPLFLQVIEQAVKNISGNISNNVWLVTGPGILTKLHKSPETQALFDGFEIRPVRLMREAVQFLHDLEYKKSKDDWRSKLDNESASIFKVHCQDVEK